MIDQGSLQIAPGESVVIEDPGSPHTFQHRTLDLVNWKTSGAGRNGHRHRIARVNIAPDIALYRFLSRDAAKCVPGITPFFPSPTNSGYTALTVAPGDSVTHCFRADNTSIGAFIFLTDSVLTDSGFGQLLDSDQPFTNGEVFTVAAQAPATTSVEFDAQWTATDGVGVVSASTRRSMFRPISGSISRSRLARRRPARRPAWTHTARSHPCFRTVRSAHVAIHASICGYRPVSIWRDRSRHRHRSMEAFRSRRHSMCRAACWC